MKNAQILIAEDDGIVAMDIQNTLQSFGYSVSPVVFSGEDAIKAAEETQPDLVLMDIVLKGDIDGIEAAGKIRDRFDIPVVYLTAYSDEETLQRAKMTEPFGYILKPFKNRELYAAIELACYRHSIECKMVEHKQNKLIADLQRDLAGTRKLSGLITMCSSCRRIRDEIGHWKGLEAYIIEHTDVLFTHGLCQECLKRLYPEQYKKITEKDSDPDKGKSQA